MVRPLGLAQDVTPFVTQFKSMDTDGSGTLTNADLTAFAQSEAAKAQSRASLMAGRTNAASHGRRLPDEIPMGSPIGSPMGAVAENV